MTALRAFKQHGLALHLIYRVKSQPSNICIVFCALQDLQEELRARQAQQASLRALWSQLQPEDGGEESDEAREKLHVTGSKLKLLLREVDQDLSSLQQRLVTI